MSNIGDGTDRAVIARGACRFPCRPPLTVQAFGLLVADQQFSLVRIPSLPCHDRNPAYVTNWIGQHRPVVP
ncbi:hypothetical protein [Rhodococcus koreensis]